jgi:hypothetical protein
MLRQIFKVLWRYEDDVFLYTGFVWEKEIIAGLADFSHGSLLFSGICRTSTTGGSVRNVCRQPGSSKYSGLPADRILSYSMVSSMLKRLYPGSYDLRRFPLVMMFHSRPTYLNQKPRESLQLRSRNTA